MSGKRNYLLAYSCLIGLLFLLSCETTDANYHFISESVKPSQNVQLDSVEVLAQPTAFACGITATTVVSNYYNGRHDTVTVVAARNMATLSSGINQTQLLQWLRAELPGHKVEYRNGDSFEVLIKNMYDSLQAGNPVVIFWGAPNPFNPPMYDFHTSVVYGMDLSSQTISISNAYGYKEILPMKEFLERMSFSNSKYYSFFQNFVIILG